MTPSEFPGLWHEGMNISRMGVVTTIHLCDLGIEGTLESMRAAFCPFSHLREVRGLLGKYREPTHTAQPGVV